MTSIAQLPSTYKFGDNESKPVVSIEQCRAHLIALGRFYELRQAVEAKSNATDAFGTYVKGAVVRFHAWMNAENKIELPSLDVAMVWHSFLLNPVFYAHDAHRLPALARLGSFPLLAIAENKDSVDTLATLETAAEELPFGIDVAAAVMRQASFIKDVVTLGWSTDVDKKVKLVIRCINRYHGFLEILRARPDVMASPTMDIDLAWHTHQLGGVTYRQDTFRITGRVINHNDNVEHEILEGHYDETADVWKELFGASYDSIGATAGKCMQCDTSVAAGKCMQCDTSAAAGKCMQCDTSVAVGKRQTIAGKCMQCDTSVAAGKCMQCDTSAAAPTGTVLLKCMQCDTSAAVGKRQNIAGKCMQCDTSVTTGKCMQCDTSVAATCPKAAEDCIACGITVAPTMIAV